MKRSKKLKLLLVLILGWPAFSLAAVFNFVPNQVNAPPGEPFEVSVFLDNQGQSINALDGGIDFSVEHLRLQEIKDADSIINFWLTRPAGDDSGHIRFAGIVPGGFTGVLSPYYSGGRPGKIFSLVFVGEKIGATQVNWRAPQALMNDGRGSPAAVSAGSLVINIQSGVNNSAPVSRLGSNDVDPPESFTPEISRDPNLFNSQWFLVFATRDTGSGLAGYQVAEYSSPSSASSSWQAATSPYLLKNQRLSSYISVRATDRSGNERVITLPPKVSLPGYADRTVWLIIIVLCIALFLYYFYYSRRR